MKPAPSLHRAPLAHRPRVTLPPDVGYLIDRGKLHVVRVTMERGRRTLTWCGRLAWLVSERVHETPPEGVPWCFGCAFTRARSA
jgi:hypothetical protein